MSSPGAARHVRVRHCSVRVRRHGGWSWGDPQAYVPQIVAAIEAALSDVAAAVEMEDGDECCVVEPATLFVAPRRTRDGREPARARRADPRHVRGACVSGNDVHHGRGGALRGFRARDVGVCIDLERRLDLARSGPRPLVTIGPPTGDRASAPDDGRARVGRRARARQSRCVEQHALRLRGSRRLDHDRAAVHVWLRHQRRRVSAHAVRRGRGHRGSR